MTKTIKVGQMPGILSEVIVPVGYTVSQVLEVANLNATGLEIKVDGAVVTSDYAVNESTNTILLVKKVKGNAGTLKIGQMPGILQEVAYETGQTVATTLEVAGLNAAGLEVKIDGAVVTDLTKSVDGANTILLVKKVKGNAGTLKIGQMPGILQEVAYETGQTLASVIEVANLNATGLEVKVDGEVVTDFTKSVDGANTILLVKKVKGNSDFTAKVGQMPGILKEVAYEGGTTYAQLIEYAGLSADGLEIKADGVVITDSNAVVGTDTNTVLLVKKVKGN